jgi:hypothetical protein
VIAAKLAAGPLAKHHGRFRELMYTAKLSMF